MAGCGDRLGPELLTVAEPRQPRLGVVGLRVVGLVVRLNVGPEEAVEGDGSARRDERAARVPSLPKDLVRDLCRGLIAILSRAQERWAMILTEMV